MRDWRLTRSHNEVRIDRKSPGREIVVDSLPV
jgi:hypothetical protein